VAFENSCWPELALSFVLQTAVQTMVLRPELALFASVKLVLVAIVPFFGIRQMSQLQSTQGRLQSMQAEKHVHSCSQVVSACANYKTRCVGDATLC
jgi:hypothetical protein